MMHLRQPIVPPKDRPLAVLIHAQLSTEEQRRPSAPWHRYGARAARAAWPVLFSHSREKFPPQAMRRRIVATLIGKPRRGNQRRLRVIMRGTARASA